MRDYNRFAATGRLTRDVELRHTASGTAVADATLASNHKFGEVDEVNFFDLVFWGARAEFAAQYLKKGKGVLVEGRLQQQRWEKDGEKRSKVVIVVEDITFLPGNKIEEGSSEPKKEKVSASPKKNEAGEDIPF